MAASIDMFAYLAAFITVVLALAVSDMLQSAHRLMGAGKRVRWSAVAILAAVAVFLAILEEFFALWRLAGVERFTFYDLLALIAPPIVLSLAAMMVLPDEVPAKGLDLWTYYLGIRRTLCLLLAIWVATVFIRLVGLFESFTRRSGTWLDAAAAFPWQTVPLLALLIILAWTRARWVQLAGLVALLVLVSSAMTDRAIEVAPPAIGGDQARPIR